MIIVWTCLKSRQSVKKFKIAFYVHHHGFGHLMRSLQIAAALKEYEVVLLGSNLKAPEKGFPENVTIIDLPHDVAVVKPGQLSEDADVYYDEGNLVDAFHYAPLNVQGIRSRAAILTDFFKQHFPLLLVVDVSVEVTLLARLCGIPTVVMCQHGRRNDQAHLIAYQSAELLLAPFPAAMYRGDKDWVYKKTIFAGGFSRFDHRKADMQSRTVNSDPAFKAKAAILIGGGGTSINAFFVARVAMHCPEIFFHIIGIEVEVVPQPANVRWEGRLDDPSPIIAACDIVIGNTGHNTVMEVASLNKRFVGIPEKRPFDEQLEKAEAIKLRKGIRIVLPGSLYDLLWRKELHELLLEEPDWQGIIAADAVAQMAQGIIGAAERLFKV
jgi:hypothetical protein